MRTCVLAALLVVTSCSERSTPSGGGAATATTPLPAAPPLAPIAADTAPPTKAAGPIEVAIESGPYRLRGELLLPAGTGPFPAVVYNHGSEPDPSLQWLGRTARWFQANGFVALFVYRRGSAGSEGPHWSAEVEAAGPSQRYDVMVSAFEREVDDVLAGVEWLARRSDVNANRIAVAGCSVGGIVSLLVAERRSRVMAAIDFAGGSMLWKRSERVRQRLREAARAAKIPLFLLQAENDIDTTPTVELGRELETAGLPHRARVFQPFGTTPMDGHAGFCNRAQELWGPDVRAFLDDPSHTPTTGPNGPAVP